MSKKGWDKVESDIESGPFGLFKWIAIVVVLFAVLFGGINMISRPAKVAVDRVVFENSWQYKKGTEKQAAILQANIDEINIKLRSNPENRQDLENQLMILNSQLKAITISQ